MFFWLAHMHIKVRHEISNNTGLVTITSVRPKRYWTIEGSVERFTEVFLSTLHIHMFSTSYF